MGGEVAAAVRGAAVASAGDAQVAGERAADTCGVVESDRVDHEARLTGRQYVIGAITSPTINGLILTFFGFTAGMWQLVDYAADIFGDRLVYGIVGSGAQITADAAGGIASTAGSMIALMAAVVFLVILLVVWIASAALSLVKWGNFVARRRGERIEVSWGLLSRSTRAVELSRVQVVRVHQSLIRRLSGLRPDRRPHRGGRRPGRGAGVCLHRRRGAVRASNCARSTRGWLTCCLSSPACARRHPAWTAFPRRRCAARFFAACTGRRSWP